MFFFEFCPSLRDLGQERVMMARVQYSDEKWFQVPTIQAQPEKINKHMYRASSPYAIFQNFPDIWLMHFWG